MSGISGVSTTSLDLFQILTANQTNAASEANAAGSNANDSTNSSGDLFANLDLSSDQQQQIQDIDQQLQAGTITPSLAQSQLKALLTTAQQATLQTDLQAQHSGHHHHPPGEPPPSHSQVSV